MHPVIYIYMYLYVFPTSSMYNINKHINKWTNKNTDTHTHIRVYIYIYECVVIPPINPFFRPGKLPWNVSQPWPERPWSWHPWPDPWLLRPRTRRRCRNGPPGWTPTSFQIGLSIKRQAMGPWGLRCAVFLWDTPKRKDGGMCHEHHHDYPRKFEVRGPHSAIPRGTTKKTWTTSTCSWYVCRMCVQVAVYHTLIWSLVYILSMKFSNVVFHLVKPIQKHPQYYQKWVVMLVKQCTATINYMLVFKTDSW